MGGVTINEISNVDFLHSLFVLKSLLGAEFGKAAKTELPSINMPEYVLMKKVSESKDGAVSLTGIREYLSISKSAVSQMLSSLEKRGMIVREVDPSNRRNLMISITPAGDTALREKDAETGSRMEKILSLLGDEDASQFARIIEKLNHAIQSTNEN